MFFFPYVGGGGENQHMENSICLTVFIFESFPKILTLYLSCWTVNDKWNGQTVSSGHCLLWADLHLIGVSNSSRFYTQTGTRRFTQVFKIILHDVRFTYDITLFTWRRTAVLTTYSSCYVPSFSKDPDLKKLYSVNENIWKM